LPLHVAIPPLAGVGQFWEQLPQWCGSVSRLTHALSHWVGMAPEHETMHPEAEQSGIPDGHIVEHARQCSGLVMSVSQPSSGFVLQWA
jgi:hypothetical protein